MIIDEKKLQETLAQALYKTRTRKFKTQSNRIAAETMGFSYSTYNRLESMTPTKNVNFSQYQKAFEHFDIDIAEIICQALRDRFDLK